MTKVFKFYGWMSVQWYSKICGSGVLVVASLCGSNALSADVQGPLTSSATPASSVPQAVTVSPDKQASFDLPFLTGSNKSQADQVWYGYDRATRSLAQKWAHTEISVTGDRTVFYPFSGPDFVSVAALFPGADHFVMVALQAAGEPASIKQMSTAKQAKFQDKFLHEWKKFAKLGFFRTDDLNQDLSDQEARIGVSTILTSFAIYSGYQVKDVFPIAVDGSGEIVQVSGPWHSVRFILSKNAHEVVLDYLSTDLSDRNLKENDPLRHWLEKNSAHPTMLKAASHLLQMPSFSVLRDMVMANAPVVVQDETGLDYTDLSKIGQVALYGGFLYPHELFNRNRQASLAQAYKESKETKPLPFAFSYNKGQERRCMQVVKRG